MRVLIACEFSGIVREAFTRKGHDAWSCDLLPSEITGQHYQCDVEDLLLDEYFDLMIAHPPCTHLCVSGAKHFHLKEDVQDDSIAFVLRLMNAPIHRIALENPVSILSSVFRKPDQIIEPFAFGHAESKPTCLWLKNLPKLYPTKLVKNNGSMIHNLPENDERWKTRSRTFPGIAEAMAEQWDYV